MSADAERLAYLLSSVGAQKHQFDHWMQQLRQGSFQYGCGVLRDADDAYDPMGVLAEINDVEWGDYDDAEQGWMIDGSAFFLTPEVLRFCLGISDRVQDRTLVEFSAAMADLADSATAHGQFADIIAHAIRIGAARRNRLEETMSRAQRQLYPVLGEYGRYDDEFDHGMRDLTRPRKMLIRGFG